MAERRTAAKLIRFHREELARITERARACARTSARFIREAALGAVPKPQQNTERDRVLRELARIGRSLDQLARLASQSEGTAIAERLAVALDAHRAAIRYVVGERPLDAPRS